MFVVTGKSITVMTVFGLILLAFVFLSTDHPTGDINSNQIIRMELIRTESIFEIALRTNSNHILQEYINKKPKPTNDTVPLYKYFDTQYYGLVNVGSPGKPFKMIFDTAWGFSWIISKDCPNTLLQCVTHAKYDHSQSSTYVPDGKSFNISNKYIGRMSQDQFLVGQMKANQSFAELSRLPFEFAFYSADGIIGIGRRELSPTYTPFAYNLFQQNQIKPIVSFYINRDPTTTHGGHIFFGGIEDKHKKSEFVSVDITSEFYWGFKMDKVSVVLNKKQKEDFCVSGCDAVIDSSSNTIVGPLAEINNINRIVGAQDIFITDRYLIPCVNEFKGPKVNFTIAGYPFQIFARDYIQKVSFSGIDVCLSAFVPAPAYSPNNTWALGGAFLYQFYTALDYEKKKIYIAEAT